MFKIIVNEITGMVFDILLMYIVPDKAAGMVLRLILCGTEYAELQHKKLRCGRYVIGMACGATKNKLSKIDNIDSAMIGSSEKLRQSSDIRDSNTNQSKNTNTNTNTNINSTPRESIIAMFKLVRKRSSQTLFKTNNSNRNIINNKANATMDRESAVTRVRGDSRGCIGGSRPGLRIGSQNNDISIMEESQHRIIHTIQLSKGDGHLPPDFLPESLALTPNVDGDVAMDYGDFNGEYTEYVIFACFINLHIDTIEYSKLMDYIMNIFDIEDEQIRILNLRDSNDSNIVQNLTNFKSFESLNRNLNIAIKQSSLNFFNSRGRGFPTAPSHGLEYNNNFQNFNININDIDIDDAVDKLGLLITQTAIMEQRSSLENDHDNDIRREDSNIDKAESDEKNSTFHTSTADTTATIGVTIGANRRADIMKTMSMNTHVSDDVRHVVVTNIDVVLRNNPKAYKK